MRIGDLADRYGRRPMMAWLYFTRALIFLGLFTVRDSPVVLLQGPRQAGKSTVVSALALHTALFQPGSLTLILSPGQRQSSETFKKVIEGRVRKIAP